MRDRISKKVKSIQPSGIRKFFDVVSEMPDAISLGVGEPDFETPWNVRSAGIEAIEKGKTFYTSNSGLMQLREEIAKYVDRKYDLKYDAGKEILITVGGSEAIDIALRSILDEGDEVLIPMPAFVSYEPCTVMAGGVPVTINLKEENEFRLTEDELRAAITPKTKAIVLSFPNNPTGAIMERKDLDAIVPIIIENDIIVITDEIYAELTYSNEKHVSIASYPGMKERTIYINGFSKAFAMTGWRLGYVCAPRDIIEQMTKIHQYAIMCSPTISQYAGVEAMRNTDEEVEMMRKTYNQRRRFLLSEFKRIGIDCFEPKGAFYVFPSIKKFGMTSDEFATRLLESHKLAVVPGSAFGECGEGFLRISYAYSIYNLKKGIARIEAFINSL